MSEPILRGVDGWVPVVQVGIGDRFDSITDPGVWNGPGVVSPAIWAGPAGVPPGFGIWGNAEPTWLDVTCFTFETRMAMGRDRAVDQFKPGTATITARNETGWADAYLPEPTDPNVFPLTPSKQARIGVRPSSSSDNSDVIWKYRGVIDVVRPGYDPSSGETVSIELIDARGDVARATIPQLAAAIGDGQSATQRLHTILNNVDYPAARRDIGVSSVQLNGTRFGKQAAEEMDIVAISSSGVIYGAPNGKLTYRNESWGHVPADQPPDNTIGNVGAGDVCPSGWEVSWARADTAVRAEVGRPNETPYVANGADASAFGIEVFKRVDLQTKQNFEIVRIANRVLAMRSVRTMPRIASVTIDATTSWAAAELLANLDPFKPTRLRCRHQDPDTGRLVFDRRMVVVGVTHNLSGDKGWQATIALDDARAFEESPATGLWNGPGVTDPAIWDTTLWATTN